jgi:phenylpropionate dioxygenase-like ring-hydroxylating dioxygenase large terminal subunit
VADSADIRKSGPFRITDPERIPVKRYYDEEFYKAENEKLWPHVWQMACRVEQIPNVGDYIEYAITGKSVFVVRTKDGIKAFHNACRHRGVQLLEGHGNCKTQGIICPFHGWRWNMDGENTFVYGTHHFDERQLDHAELALTPCRAEEAIGCVFINFDADAPSLRDTIGPMLDRVEARAASKMRAEWCYATVLPANWKTAQEAFMEGYHVMRTHPQLQAACGPMYNSLYGIPTEFTMVNPELSSSQNIKNNVEHMKLLSEGMAGMCHEKDYQVAKDLENMDLPEDPNQAIMVFLGTVNAEATRRSRERGEPTPDLNAVMVSDPLQAVEFIFPNYFLLPFMSSMAAYRIRPLGPESCMFEIWSLTLFPEGQEPEPVMEPKILPYDSKEFPPIPQQDYSNIPRQQIGLHAEGFEFMRLGKNIEGLISNYNRVIDGYLAGAPGEKLAKATQELAGNFDGQIKDLGL